VAQIEITDEQEGEGGWTFGVHVRDEARNDHRCRVHLSWADYNLWSPNGADAPAEVAKAAVAFLYARRGMKALKSSFDVAMLRRIDPDADETVPQWIGRSDSSA